MSWKRESRRHALASKGVRTGVKTKSAVMNKVPNKIPLKSFETIVMVGRRWRDDNGNTYHSTEVFVDGKLIGKEDFAYGYENQYQETGLKILQEKGYFNTTNEHLSSGIKKDGYDFRMYARENPSKVMFVVNDVSRKKDL